MRLDIHARNPATAEGFVSVSTEGFKTNFQFLVLDGLVAGLAGFIFCAVVIKPVFGRDFDRSQANIIEKTYGIFGTIQKLLDQNCRGSFADLAIPERVEGEGKIGLFVA